MIGTQAMPMSIAVGEEPTLQHLVRARLDTGYHVRRVEGHLFHVGEIVLGVAIQHQFAYRYQREFLVRPYLLKIAVQFSSD